MKTKVLTYKNDGNTLTDKYMELTNWFDNIYYSEADEYEVHYIVVECRGQFAVLSSIRTYQITDENKEITKKELDNLFEWMMSQRWIQSLYIEFARRCGMNYELLKQKRNAIIQERENEQRIKDEQRAKELEEGQKEYALKMQGIKDRLLSGECINTEDIHDAITFFKFKVHPRTLGTIIKLKGVIGINSATKSKGMTWNTHHSIIETVKQFANS